LNELTDQKHIQFVLLKNILQEEARMKSSKKRRLDEISQHVTTAAGNASPISTSSITNTPTSRDIETRDAQVA